MVSQFCLKATADEKEVLKFSESNVNFLDYYKIALVGLKSTKTNRTTKYNIVLTFFTVLISVIFVGLKIPKLSKHSL